LRVSLRGTGSIEVLEDIKFIASINWLILLLLA
jgi:hypothetical protein